MSVTYVIDAVMRLSAIEGGAEIVMLLSPDGVATRMAVSLLHLSGTLSQLACCFLE
jgi:hypothetical protein